jgi:hypothetical protein
LSLVMPWIGAPVCPPTVEAGLAVVRKWPGVAVQTARRCT